nr:uncharacterized protein LOC109164764 [Ipomoea trifida]
MDDPTWELTSRVNVGFIIPDDESVEDAGAASEGGCEYFIWKNALWKEDKVGSDWNKNVEIELKKMKYEITEEIRQLRSDVKKG